MAEGPKTDVTLESLLNVKAIKEQTQDVLNETGVTSEDDITYEITDSSTIQVHYGKHKFNIKIKQLTSPDLKEKLRKLGLTYTLKEDGSIASFKYNNKLINQVY